ncbi:hypothetical protein [Bordetella genomosp. 13]|uniref:hypothetical protein n=1 Tax=Bordetella genomosp. 13 TaxID=463040 RepID=UPI0011A4DFE0|nr:hypothetical protein [Bordetella genomosp. 13]
MLNLMQLQAGQWLALKDGRTAEIVENIGDGIWVQVRFDGGDEAGELVHCEEVSGLARGTGD